GTGNQHGVDGRHRSDRGSPPLRGHRPLLGGRIGAADRLRPPRPDQQWALAAGAAAARGRGLPLPGARLAARRPFPGDAPRRRPLPARARPAGRRVPRRPRAARGHARWQRHRRRHQPARGRAPPRAHRRPRPPQLRRLRALPTASGASLQMGRVRPRRHRADGPRVPPTAGRPAGLRPPRPPRPGSCRARLVLRPVQPRTWRAARPDQGPPRPRQARDPGGRRALPELPPAGPDRLGRGRPGLPEGGRAAPGGGVPRRPPGDGSRLPRLRLGGPAGPPSRADRLRRRPAAGPGRRARRRARPRRRRGAV
ncbi:MAG: Hydrolase, alpha/beta fold family, partial [uncultured Thermomicrobiales bacterium]